MPGCTTASRNRLFLANRFGSILQLQSISNGQYVIQRSNDMLYANAPTAGGNVPKALQFLMGRVRVENPRPVTGSNAFSFTGTWRGNNAGSYCIRQTGNIISWRGRGGNFNNIFVGERRGNIVLGYWQDTARSQTQNSGHLSFRINNDSQLVRISHIGAIGNSSWSR